MEKNIIIGANHHERLEAERAIYRTDISEITVPSISIDLESVLNTDAIPTRFNIKLGSAHFECFFKEKKNDWLYVFFAAARNDLGRLPRFPRWSWHPFVNGSALYVEDPMYYKFPTLKCGWFFGAKNEDYMEHLSKIVRKIAKRNGVPDNHIVFYGSSSGGTGAINCSSFIEDSISVSINPQLFPHLERTTRLIEFTKDSIDDSSFQDKINLLEKVKSGKSKNLIIVNSASKDDMEGILKWCKEIGINLREGIVQKNNILVWIYDAYGVPKPHNSFEDLPLFKMITKLVGKISKCKNEDDLETFALEQNDFVLQLNEFWFERYVTIRTLKMKQIDLMLRCSSDGKILKEAYAECLELAESGDAEAMLRLAGMYRDGKPITKNLNKAIEWMRKSAKNKVRAKSGLVDLLLKRSAKGDIEEAFGLCSELAETGDAEAMLRLARMYRDGKPIVRNLNRSIDWMRKSVEYGNPRAKSGLVDLLLKRSAKGDIEEAFGLCSELAETGDAEAKDKLTTMCNDVEKN